MLSVAEKTAYGFCSASEGRLFVQYFVKHIKIYKIIGLTDFAVRRTINGCTIISAGRRREISC